MDILALIAAEPTLLPLWAVLVFAAGMYPVAMLFSCTPCCNPCSSCTQGSLPDTLTVAFSGIPETTPGPDLISLSFSSCFGSGASGRVTAPGQSVVGGDPADDRGPITAVSLTDGGSGYASLGRAAPTLSAYVDSWSGTGAEFSVSTQLAQGECGRDYWKVSSVVAKTGGSGYADGDRIIITVSDGDTEDQAAYVTLFTDRSEPTLTASVPDSWTGGSGADLSVVLAQNTGTPATWQVASVTVNNGGSGYDDGDSVQFELGQGDQIDGWSAWAHVRTIKAEPTVGFSPSYANGTGAVLTPVLSSFQGGNRWKVSSATITSPGTGYAVNNMFASYSDDGTVQTAAYLVVSQVDSNGGILAVTVAFTDGGSHYRNTGIIGEVLVYDGGRYYKGGGGAGGGDIYSGGIYYREDASLPPYVDDVTVTISQTSPSDGDGAVITAQVEDDTGSPDFGKVVGLTVENGGDGYLAHELFASCLGRFNGRSIVVKRNYPFWRNGQCCPFFPMSLSPEACTYGYTCANTSDPCSLEAEAVRVEYHGPNEPMTVFLMLHQRGQTTLPLGGGYYYPAAYGLLTAQENVENCSDIDVTAYGSQWLPEEATAHVQGGGEYEDVDACKRISAEDMDAIYTEVTWGAFSSSSADSGSGCGWSLSVSIGGETIDTTGQWCEEWKDSLQSRADHYIDTFYERGGTGYIGGPAFGVGGNCSQSISFGGLSTSIYKGEWCEWKWSKPHNILFRVTRSFSWHFYYWNIYGPVSNPFSASRSCDWVYPVLSMPVDEDGIPSGQVELGDPTFATIGGTPAGNEWLDDLLTEQEVCVPGTPTITISRLP